MWWEESSPWLTCLSSLSWPSVCAAPSSWSSSRPCRPTTREWPRGPPSRPPGLPTGRRVLARISLLACRRGFIGFTLFRFVLQVRREGVGRGQEGVGWGGGRGRCVRYSIGRR